MMDIENPLETILGDSDSAAEAMKKANEGVYDTTLLEQWVFALENQIRGAEAPLNMHAAHQLLMQWTFLEHRHLPNYMRFRRYFLWRALDAVNETIEASPKSREALFLENENDFRLHRDMYREIMARFTELQMFWQEDWMTIDLESDAAPAAHAATVDVMNILAGQYGLLIELRSLKDYGFDDEVDGVWLKERVEELAENRKHSEYDGLTVAVDAALKDHDE